jgi:hypothetical protein
MIRWLKEFLRHSREIDTVARAFDSPPCATDWDVAEAAEPSEPAHEPGRIEYRFLGTTGMEDE